MDILNFFIANYKEIAYRTEEHIFIVFLAVSFAILFGVTVGIYITQHKKTADVVLYIASIIITIPSIALFGLMIPVLSLINEGIGYLPAIIAVFLYSLLPIIRNTYTAIMNIDPALREAAKGMGMTNSQRLLKVEIPLSIPIIMAGVRYATVLNIGVTAIAAYIGAGGLGTFISQGISQSNSTKLMVGAISVSILAVMADYFLLFIQNKVTSKGLK
ncbi:MAG: ABC transporter permease [Epsilonproteobacteria bacterium]|nr:ABC transporter permease [Campylobacterota bacterium]